MIGALPNLAEHARLLRAACAPQRPAARARAGSGARCLPLDTETRQRRGAALHTAGLDEIWRDSSLCDQPGRPLARSRELLLQDALAEGVTEGPAAGSMAAAATWFRRRRR
jgi:hypothetical protein